jgi:Protein of unknown function (DUF2924)
MVDHQSEDVQGEIARLERASLRELRVEWRRCYRTSPPARLGRDLLLRAVTYKLQERVYGGLSQAARRSLHSLAKQRAANGPDTLSAAPALKPGIRLVRQWGSQVHAVLVLADGFDYRGERYRSLTQIATLITGAHWSGPRFFGLARAPRCTAERRAPPTTRPGKETGHAEAPHGPG